MPIFTFSHHRGTLPDKNTKNQKRYARDIKSTHFFHKNIYLLALNDLRLKEAEDFLFA